LIRDALKQAGMWDDTAFFFFSDHGDFTGDYGLVENDIAGVVLTCQEDVLDRYIEIAAARRTYKNFVRWLVPRLPLDILRII
jgi:arylsulfatase A-like enzyme